MKFNRVCFYVLFFLLLGNLPLQSQTSRSDYYFINEAVTLSPDWKLTQDFGFFYDANFPWIYHNSLGFNYLAQGGPNNDFYMWSKEMNSWIWSQKFYFPFAYHFNYQTWVWFHLDGTNSWYYHYNAAQWYKVGEGPVIEPDPEPEPPRLPSTLPEVSRFLSMATLGANYETIVQVQEQGVEAWLEEQFNMPPTYAHSKMLELHPALLNFPVFVETGVLYEVLQNLMMTSQDQLRQKVALALSEILVVSIIEDETESATPYIHYYDVLLEHAFGNYEDLLYAVSLNPLMGFYLSHAGNQKAIPEIGLHPDENYAREIMQLFSVGLHELHPDGTWMLDEWNKPIPTYTDLRIANQY